MKLLAATTYRCILNFFAKLIKGTRELPHILAAKNGEIVLFLFKRRHHCLSESIEKVVKSLLHKDIQIWNEAIAVHRFKDWLQVKEKVIELDKIWQKDTSIF
jgi:hypothetical protein